MNEHEQTIANIATLLQSCESLLFITGAGISAESGIPTYRGVGGLYDVEQTEEGYPIEEVLSSSMLAENPGLTWKYLLQIGKAVSGAKHNRAHEIIAEFEGHFPRVLTLTQNVDGFHGSAGSKNVIEAHGNMYSLSCTSCGYQTKVEDFKGEFAIPPQCPQCEGLIRPDVVLFGELLSGDGIERMQEEMMRGFDLVVSIGTSMAFPYIQLPIEAAQAMGTPTVEINPSRTGISELVEYYLPLGASEALEAIWSGYQKQFAVEN